MRADKSLEQHGSAGDALEAQPILDGSAATGGAADSHLYAADGGLEGPLEGSPPTRWRQFLDDPLVRTAAINLGLILTWWVGGQGRRNMAFAAMCARCGLLFLNDWRQAVVLRPSGRSQLRCKLPAYATLTPVLAAAPGTPSALPQLPLDRCKAHKLAPLPVRTVLSFHAAGTCFPRCCPCSTSL